MNGMMLGFCMFLSGFGIGVWASYLVNERYLRQLRREREALEQRAGKLIAEARVLLDRARNGNAP